MRHNILNIFFKELDFTSLSLYQTLALGTMGLSQSCISGATSSLFIYFVFVGAQRVL